MQKAGFTENQVRAQIENSKEQTIAINGLINDNLATKQDIKELEFKITSMGYKITIATGLMIAASIGVLNYLIKLH